MVGKVKKYWLFIMFIILISIRNIYAKDIDVFRKEGYLAVAKWDMDIIMENYNVDMISGNGIYDYELKVINNSEVAANYVIKISNIPAGLLISLDDGNYEIADSNNQVMFERIININDSKTHIIHFKPTIDLMNLSNYQMMIDVLCVGGD